MTDRLVRADGRASICISITCKQAPSFPPPQPRPPAPAPAPTGWRRKDKTQARLFLSIYSRKQMQFISRPHGWRPLADLHTGPDGKFPSIRLIRHSAGSWARPRVFAFAQIMGPARKDLRVAGTDGRSSSALRMCRTGCFLSRPPAESWPAQLGAGERALSRNLHAAAEGACVCACVRVGGCVRGCVGVCVCACGWVRVLY